MHCIPHARYCHLETACMCGAGGGFCVRRLPHCSAPSTGFVSAHLILARVSALEP